MSASKIQNEYEQVVVKAKVIMDSVHKKHSSINVLKFPQILVTQYVAPVSEVSPEKEDSC